jgi:hypothetical protein
VQGRNKEAMATNTRDSTQGTPVASGIPVLASGEWVVAAVEAAEPASAAETAAAAEAAEPVLAPAEAPRMRSSRIQELLEALRTVSSGAHLQIGDILLAPYQDNGDWYVTILRRGQSGKHTVDAVALSAALEVVLEVASTDTPLVRFG